TQNRPPVAFALPATIAPSIFALRLAPSTGIKLFVCPSTTAHNPRITTNVFLTFNMTIRVGFECYTFSVKPLCSLCLCGSLSLKNKPQRHREHRGCTEKKL